MGYSIGACEEIARSEQGSWSCSTSLLVLGGHVLSNGVRACLVCTPRLETDAHDSESSAS